MDTIPCGVMNPAEAGTSPFVPGLLPRPRPLSPRAAPVTTALGGFPHTPAPHGRSPLSPTRLKGVSAGRNWALCTHAAQRARALRGGCFSFPPRAAGPAAPSRGLRRSRPPPPGAGRGRPAAGRARPGAGSAAGAGGGRPGPTGGRAPRLPRRPPSAAAAPPARPGGAARWRQQPNAARSCPRSRRRRRAPRRWRGAWRSPAGS